jgi:predicted PurR-regulated permease PerM
VPRRRGSRRAASGAPAAWRGHVVRQGAIVAGALAASLGALALIYLLARALALLVAAITLAEAMSPLAKRLSRWMPHTLACVVVFVGLLALGTIGLLIPLPALASEAQSITEKLPDLFSRLQSWIAWGNQVANVDLEQMLASRGKALVSGLLSFPLTLLSGLIELVVVVFLALYWLVGSDERVAWVLSLFPRDRHAEVRTILHETSNAMGGYVRGVAIDALVVGFVVWVSLRVIGVSNALVLAVLAAAGEAVPYVGPLVGAVPAVGFALLDSPTKALMTAGLYVAIQQFEGHVLTPNVMNAQTRLSPVIVIFALLAGAALGGLLGALVAVPIAGALRVLLRHLAAPRVRRWTGAATPRSPAGIVTSSD